MGLALATVTLADVTRPAVLAAVAEFDRLGRDEFLQASGFGRARSYYLDLDGQLYDSKAIVGYAHGVATGMALRASDFTGGDLSLAHRLRALGFVVRRLRNPDWTRDEIILACALVEANGWRPIAQEDQRAIELSQLLQSPAIHPLDERGPEFRNPAGVERKTSDIATRHPDYTGRPTNGNRLDREILQDFLARPTEMHSLARAIREALAAGSGSDGPSPVDLDLADVSANEGGVLYRQHLRRERDPKLRSAKLTDAKRRGQVIACEVCSFDFGKVYGLRGEDYIECHHRIPLHVSGPTRTRLEDLAMLCSNCHRMIHRSTPWLTVEDLQALLMTAATP